VSVVSDFFGEIDRRWTGTPSTKIPLFVLGSAALLLRTDYERGTKDSDVLETRLLTAETKRLLIDLAGKAKLEAEARAKSLRPPAGRDRRLVLLVAAVAVAAVVLALLFFPRSAQRESPIAVPSATAPPSVTVGASAPTQSARPPDAAPLPDDEPQKK
jgi:hypothetical protein